MEGDGQVQSTVIDGQEDGGGGGGVMHGLCMRLATKTFMHARSAFRRKSRRACLGVVWWWCGMWGWWGRGWCIGRNGAAGER